MTSEALPTFLAEAYELSENIEFALLAFESGTANAETINSLFRSMHTIKGSAGLFGLDDIVAFAHVFETVLARVREGRLQMTPDLVAVLIDGRDHLDRQFAALNDAGHRDENEAAELDRRAAELVSRLQAIAGPVTSANPVATPVTQAVATPDPASFTASHVGSDCWHISLRYMPDTLRNGMDPLASLAFLGTFGTIRAIAVLDDALPGIDAFDAESCYLGFECRFDTTADRQRIDSVFEFVRQDCTLTILPPRSLVADYIRLVRQSAESEERLGEILVRVGSLTPQELESALKVQRETSEPPAAPLGAILVERQIVPPEVVAAAVDKQRAAAESRSREQRSVRVDADKLEALLNLVSELVIEGAQTRHLAQRANLSELNESSARLSRLVEQVRDQSLKLRMVPIGAAFSRFSRLVRDVSRELGKQIVLETHGEETELDRTLIESITDPLTHLVRNSIDHGIESAQVRRERGKSEQGMVRLNAYHDSGSVIVEVSDDGGGLDRERILRKAVERGLVAPDQQLSDAEIHDLIFAAGFSTADAVTNLSGRGVGMDVVKRNVAQLRGSIDIESRPGRGTTFRIRLPLTLAIIDGFLVRVGASAFVLPLEMVEECVEPSRVTTLLETGPQYIDLRGQVLPLVRLRDHFNIASASTRRESIVVVRCANQRVGFVVDELLGEHQTVIKPLARMFQHLRGLGGSTILADGGIALIVDIPALIQQCGVFARVGRQAA